MKKFVFSIIAILAVISCSVEPLEPFDEENAQVSATLGPIVFDLQANHPDMQTKAVKTGWEAGDAIFVFFSNVSAPKFLKMSYDGSDWTAAEYNGDTATPGALGLVNGNTGTMRAVFLPFGSNATVSADGTKFVFNKTYYAYYLTATLEYTVVGNKVSGAFDMAVPDDYVQFFVEDAYAVDEACSLGCDAVIPVGVASIAANGTVNETTGKTAADDMPGYAYSGGYLFSGKLGSWGYDSNYYFAKTKADGTERHDYFVTGKTLASHSSVKLPASGDSKWQAVGSDKLVQLTYDGSDPNVWWSTCDYDQSLPELTGTKYQFAAANSISGVSLPSKAQFQSIIDNCTWIPMSIHGKNGGVMKSDSGFLFFPAHDNTNGSYWTSTPDDDINYAWSFYFSGPVHTTGRVVHFNTFPARPVTVRPEAIDLGLPSGTKWANMNVGASSKTEYGDYFAWGETTGYNSGKTNFSWSTYFDTSDGGGSFSKYYNGEKTELDLDNDAAYQNWGSHWRMPSKEQCEELINSNYTTVTWTTVSGVNGRLITSRSNTNSIFIPALSNCDGNGIRTTLSGNWGYCWTRTLTSTDTKAWYLTFSSSSIWVNSEDHRAYGLPVRAVWVE